MKKDYLKPCLQLITGSLMGSLGGIIAAMVAMGSGSISELSSLFAFIAIGVVLGVILSIQVWKRGKQSINIVIFHVAIFVIPLVMLILAIGYKETLGSLQKMGKLLAFSFVVSLISVLWINKHLFKKTN